MDLAGVKTRKHCQFPKANLTPRPPTLTDETLPFRFFTNSQKNVIYAYDYDIETGTATNRRVHIDTSSLGATDFSIPDGLCIDSEGGIWSARYA